MFKGIITSKRLLPDGRIEKSYKEFDDEQKYKDFIKVNDIFDNKFFGMDINNTLNSAFNNISKFMDGLDLDKALKSIDSKVREKFSSSDNVFNNDIPLKSGLVDFNKYKNELDKINEKERIENEEKKKLLEEKLNKKRSLEEEKTMLQNILKRLKERDADEKIIEDAQEDLKKIDEEIKNL